MGASGKGPLMRVYITVRCIAVKDRLSERERSLGVISYLSLSVYVCPCVCLVVTESGYIVTYHSVSLCACVCVCPLLIVDIKFLSLIVFVCVRVKSSVVTDSGY